MLLGAEVTVWRGIAPVAWVGVQRRSDGAIDPRDAVLGVSLRPVATDTLVVRVQPGLNLPTGGIGSELYFTPLSTASVDPYLTADVVYGGAWLVGGTSVLRVPVYDGWDKRRQGPFARLDARVARRIGVVVPWVGLSGVRQFPSDPVGSVPSFSELAATGGAVVNFATKWSSTLQVRVPVAVSAEAARQLSAAIAVQRVFGGPGGEDEDDHEHGPGDGHDHPDGEHPDEG